MPKEGELCQSKKIYAEAETMLNFYIMHCSALEPPLLDLQEHSSPQFC